MSSLNRPSRQWNLPTRHIGKQVLYWDETGSTNDLAAELIQDPQRAGTVLLAGRQSAGRGQFGRVWQSPAGVSVLLSTALLPPAQLRRPVLLTAWAAVAVGECILETTGLQARIKWPNDLLLHGAKVCGILIEQGNGVIVGIGLNVQQTAAEFEALGLPNAVSLHGATGRHYETAEVARSLIFALDEWYDRLLNGEEALLESCWQWRMGLLGKTVQVEHLDGSQLVGRLREQSFRTIVVENPAGDLHRLTPETIRHLVAVA